jgi:4a-hydroxytetrahydrobiopterin dehydratase
MNILPQNLLTWKFTPDEKAITKTFTLVDFLATIRMTQKIAEIAEAEGHHPDIFIHEWNKLTLTLSTHSEGGVTEKDFSLASKIDALTQ